MGKIILQHNNLLHTCKKLIGLFLILGVQVSVAQYVSPNQPGRAGGNTQPSPASYGQVATSTYYGTDGTFSGQGTLLVTDKNPPPGVSNLDGRVMHFFKGGPSDASYPWYTTPFTATDGNLYGSSFYGGTSFLGAVYKFDVAAADAGTCTGNTSVIYDMAGTGGSYGNYANVNELSDGLIYVPETAGGSFALGKITKMGKDGSSPTTLHDFVWNAFQNDPNRYSPGAKLQPGYATWGATLSLDGAYPYGFVTEGPDGYVYGTTVWGGLGIQNQAYGTVYKMQKDGSDYQILAYGSNLDVGTHPTADGGTVSNTIPFAIPWGNVAFDQAGEYAYFFGGAQGGFAGATFGDVCRVKIDGTEPVEIVHKFKWDGLSNTDPYYLYRGPIIIDNELFGTTYYGGSGTYGTVWKLDLSKLNPTDNPIDANGVNNTVQTLHNFTFTDGAYPFGGLIYDGEFLYGSTQQGGYTGTSYGTVYKIKPDGSQFQSILDLKSAGTPCPDAPPAETPYAVYYPSNERVTLIDFTNTVCYACLLTETTCPAGTDAPTLSGNTLANTCPATTADLTTLQTGTPPAGTSVTWHTASPTTNANKVTDPTAVAAGTYYAAFYDATEDCYSLNSSEAVTVTINSCGGAFTASDPAPKSAAPDEVVNGNAATELSPAGGTAPYVYSDGSTDPGCVAPSGATALPSGSVTVTNSSTGEYSVTSPNTAGTYYYCIKVCDSATPTPACEVKTYTLTVSGVSCNAGTAAPLLQKN